MSRIHVESPCAPIVHLPRTDPELLRGLIEAFEAVAVQPSQTSHQTWMTLSIPLVETCLTSDSAEPKQLAEVLLMSQLPGLPEQMALQVAFGRELAEASAQHIASIIDRATREEMSVDDYVDRLVATGTVPDTLAGPCVRGETRQRPDSGRIARGIALFRSAAGAAPTDFRPSLLCVVAWLLWAQGKRANALAYLDEARRHEPENVVANSFATLFRATAPCWL